MQFIKKGDETILTKTKFLIKQKFADVIYIGFRIGVTKYCAVWSVPRKAFISGTHP